VPGPVQMVPLLPGQSVVGFAVATCTMVVMVTVCPPLADVAVGVREFGGVLCVVAAAAATTLPGSEVVSFLFRPTRLHGKSKKEES